MMHISKRKAAFCVAALLLAAITPVGGVTHAQPAQALSANVSILTTGLQAPRGVTFGPDGNLYVAEAGTAGDRVATCTPEPPPWGPYAGGLTARISRISMAGVRTTVADKLPSFHDSSGEVYGMEGVAFVGDTLYGLEDVTGCEAGFPEWPSGLVRVHNDGTVQLIADLSAFIMANPVKERPLPGPQGGDYEEFGEFFGITAVGDTLYVVESNSGQVLKVTTDGTISRFFDLSVGHPVPTTVAYHDGNVYLGNLGVFPVARGSQQVLRITPTGQSSVAVPGLTAVTSIAFDKQGRLYALETSTTDKEVPTAGTGRVVRVSAAGALEEVATGLTYPIGMAFGPDGQLYVSNFAYSSPGAGQVLRINVESSGPPTLPLPLPKTGVVGAPLLFPETGYSLEDEFLRYWQTNGGLPVFGYPVTSAHQVDGQVSQLLERARFERHAEQAAPYNVQLSRLGVEALEHQGRDWTTFAKAMPDAAHYFPQTGHAITDAAFWRYWSGHGLEFDGRPGTSNEESLALFGYPISEPQTETNANGDSVLTQWFERARFEYHPNNPEPYTVLLGRLGADLLSERVR